MKMPKTVFVRIDKESNGDEYLNAFSSPAEAVDGDGPTKIGVYTLTEVTTARKRLEVSK